MNRYEAWLAENPVKNWVGREISSRDALPGMVLHNENWWGDFLVLSPTTWKAVRATARDSDMLGQTIAAPRVHELATVVSYEPL